MKNILPRIHRTWVQLLIEYGFKDIAAIAVDCELDIGYTESYGEAVADSVTIDVPVSMNLVVKKDARIQKAMEESLFVIMKGHVFDENLEREDFKVSYRLKLLGAEENWKNIVRELIVNSEHPNQGIVTEKMFAKRGKEPLTYNEMKFASQSEIRIAQEFERRKVLFFPLPLAVRADTGNLFEDHREIDFLVCNEGVWGILEVAHHPDRFEKDSEKNLWFKRSGILCAENFTAERCYSDSANVVSEFLSVLTNHKR